MKTLLLNQLSTQAKYKIYLMRKIDNHPIFAKKVGKGVTLLKVDFPIDSKEYLEKINYLENSGWYQVLAE